MPSSSTSLALIFLTITKATAAAKEFRVGDDVGWRVPASNETELYNVWASRRRFHVGFQYKNDSVVMTVKFQFHHCDSNRPISSFDDGNTVINLDRVGKFYFISGKAGRCNRGQKMVVNVKDLHHSTPSIVTSPNGPNVDMSPSPSPSQLTGSGASDFRPAISANFSVLPLIVALAGLWLCVVHP